MNAFYVLYFLVAGFGSATLVVLASIGPLPPRGAHGTKAAVVRTLSLGWLLAIVVGSGYVVYRTAAGSDDDLLPLVLLLFAPACGVALVRIGRLIRSHRTSDRTFDRYC